jgi:hypothetical protein
MPRRIHLARHLRIGGDAEEQLRRRDPARDGEAPILRRAMDVLEAREEGRAPFGDEWIGLSSRSRA